MSRFVLIWRYEAAGPRAQFSHGISIRTDTQFRTALKDQFINRMSVISLELGIKLERELTDARRVYYEGSVESASDFELSEEVETASNHVNRADRTVRDNSNHSGTLDAQNTNPHNKQHCYLCTL